MIGKRSSGGVRRRGDDCGMRHSIPVDIHARQMEASRDGRLDIFSSLKVKQIRCWHFTFFKGQVMARLILLHERELIEREDTDTRSLFNALADFADITHGRVQR